MRKILAIFLITPLLICAQEKEKISLVNIGFSLLPEVNALITDNPIGKEKSTARIGFSLGFNLEFKLSPKIFFKSGLGYGLKKYDHTHSNLVFGTDIGPNGIISMSKIESKISFSELQLPLILLFQVKDSKFFISTGMEVTYPISNNSERIIYYGNGSIDKLTGSNNYSTLNFAPQLGFGYNIPAGKKLNVGIEALIKYYIKEYIIAESHLYNYGVKATLNFDQLK